MSSNPNLEEEMNLGSQSNDKYSETFSPEKESIDLKTEKIKSPEQDEEEEELVLHALSKDIAPSEVEEEFDFKLMSNLDAQSKARFPRPHSQTSQRSGNSGNSNVSKGELSEYKQSILSLLRNAKDPKALIALYEQYRPQNPEIKVEELKSNVNTKIKKYKDSLYFGGILNGKRHGKGIMLYADTRVYEGEWENDLKHGRGLEILANDNYYQGQFLNGKPEGFGSFVWMNGELYEGEWKNGLKHGTGLWKGVKGESYNGEWRNGKAEGYGVHKWRNGDRYEGQMKGFLKHGQGTEKFVNGDYYVGNYINGKPDGYGEYYWGNGCQYKGNFRNGLRHGDGVWKKGPDHADVYEGEWVNDKKYGQGVYTWVSGNRYIGEYFDDMRHGYGEMYWTDGSYYKGAWERGIQHGEGELMIPGKALQKGMFVNNEFSGEGEGEAKEAAFPRKVSVPKNDYDSLSRIQKSRGSEDSTKKMLIPIIEQQRRQPNSNRSFSQSGHRKMTPTRGGTGETSYYHVKNSFLVDRGNPKRRGYLDKSNEESSRFPDLQSFDGYGQYKKVSQQKSRANSVVRQVNLTPSDVGYSRGSNNSNPLPKQPVRFTKTKN